MEAHYIDYKETRSFSSAAIRYIENDASLKPFYNQPATLDGFDKLLSTKKNTANRIVLNSVLKEQYKSLEISQELQKNIELLKNENCFTVTTGHQLNLFTGPLYFIFKIVSAINLARDLKIRFPESDFVPVYWMATEDHDFAEINHTYINSKKVAWETEVNGATGRISTDKIKATIAEYISALGISENATDLAQIIEEAYNENNLANATRHLVNKLFGNYGLVIVDADDAQLKAQFSNIIAEDIISENSYRNITTTNDALANAGINPQVNPREINFFYLLDNLRERIVCEYGCFKVLNTDISFSEAALRQEITNHPERFSPNVIMRPLYQEVILPNLAYIGGPAELIYWLQLKSNFDYYKIDFPILILRNCASISSQKIDQKLERLGFSYRDIFKNKEDLKNEWVLKSTDHNLSIDDEWREIDCIFEKLKLRAHKIDPTLAPSTQAIKIRLQKAMGNLEKKLLKAEKKNHSEALNNIENIKEILFPNGTLQERKENFGMFYVKYGKDFIPALLKNLHPLDFKYTILS